MNNYIHLFTVECSACSAPNDWNIENLPENVVTVDGKYRVTCKACNHTDTYDARQIKSNPIPATQS
jgi:hypothetical protein